MMRVAVMLALLGLPASAALAEPRRDASPQRIDAPGRACFDTRVRHAGPGAPARPRTLDQLPTGNLYHAVERQVDGCRELVLVSEERRRR